MIRIICSVDVAVPAPQAYAQLIQFETYPLFMENVVAVRASEDRLQWRAHKSNGFVEWNSEITAKVPDRMIAWRDLVAEGHESTTISLHEVDRTHCKIQVVMHVDLHVEPDQVATAESEMIESVEADFARFKALMEHPEAKPFDTSPPGKTGVEYSHPKSNVSSDLLTDTPGSPAVPTSKEMAKSPGADGQDNRIDLTNQPVATKTQS